MLVPSRNGGRSGLALENSYRLVCDRQPVGAMALQGNTNLLALQVQLASFLLGGPAGAAA